ncbi:MULTISPECIES: sulfate/molybdate ABC transporter ATP-binding protein [Campylobacter]|uniref:sulfate/molybdate ABC transporter ATP-binding protein n=1 Tax=Campylobacter TaxID=194 RepID=UPI000A32F335|nr:MULTISPECIES: ATP-binding cassette domain-containing protein [unclassified Campylobacter]MCR8679041.1 ATP-binding cassette domain-containing protein [Campylobacter sp. RM19072]
MINFHCQKSFNGFELDAKFSVENGEFVALYGKSGSGKSTILRLLAGFDKPNSGVISNNEQIYYNKDIFLPPQKRNIGYLFQDYALFPNMSVMQNLLFAKNDIKFATELLELTQLLELKNVYPHTLSGGQKQRTALARALMRHPKLLLLDEPLSALDTNLRTKLQEYLSQIHKKYGMSIIIVSHDKNEIYRLASRVFIVDSGKIIQSGSPKELFLNSNSHQNIDFLATILEINQNLITCEYANQIYQITLPNSLNSLKIGDTITLSTQISNLKVTI